MYVFNHLIWNFKQVIFSPQKIWIEACSEKHIDLLLCYLGPLEFHIVMWLLKGSCQNYPDASLKWLIYLRKVHVDKSVWVYVFLLCVEIERVWFDFYQLHLHDFMVEMWRDNSKMVFCKALLFGNSWFTVKSSWKNTLCLFGLDFGWHCDLHRIIIRMKFLFTTAAVNRTLEGWQEAGRKKDSLDPDNYWELLSFFLHMWWRHRVFWDCRVRT